MENNLVYRGATQELESLQPFIGIWRTEGEIIDANNSSPIPINGTDSYEWLPGGYFVMHKIDVIMGDQQVEAIEIIGYNPDTNQFTMNYFGYKGSTSVMFATVHGKRWKFYSPTERFIGSFNEDNNVLEGIWEQNHNSHWAPWMNIKLTRQW